MTPERWQQIEAIFQLAIERGPENRVAFLLQACGGDDELRADVESLLAHEVADTFLKAPIKGAARSLANDADDARVGQRIGAYRVTGLIGHGGMGAVYRAVRDDDQYQKQVALKLVKRGMDTDLVLDRFRYERQILASLEHAHIARLLDGGTTEDDLPYLVMEYIEGEPITTYCKTRDLSVSERLKLFLQVCSAVAYAHQNLVVHRDLKPGNIMVTKQGELKLLDFGIAKLLAPDLSPDATPQTATELRLMTPDYSSPEQVRGLPITTATDVYSLGVVLYELLTGERPHRLKNFSPSEIERAICHTEPEKPSAAVRRMPGATAKLRKQLSGDPDNIVMMAMRKEPDRRYSSVEQFAEDIRRYLEGRPVIARQDTITYLTSKFILRHKLGVATTALVIFSLVGGIVMTNYQARRAERRFQEVRKLANTFLFDFHDKIQNLPGSTEARELVVNTALEYLDSLAAEIGDDPVLTWELATAYQKVGDVQGDPWAPSLGHPDEAMKSYQRASALTQTLAAANKDDLKIQRALARNYFKIGTLRAETGDKENSYGLLRQSISISEEVARRSGERNDGAYLCDSYIRLGDVYLDTGDARNGLEFYRKSLEVSKGWAQKLKDDHRTLYSTGIDHSHVGEALASIGDLTGAIENYRQAVLIQADVVNRVPNNDYYKRSLQVSLNWLGNLSGNPRFINAGDLVTAEKYYRESLAIGEKIAASDPKNATARLDLSTACTALGDVLAESDPAKSADYYRRALASMEPVLAGAPNELRFLRRQANILKSSAAPLVKLGERETALKNLRESLRIMRDLSSRYPTNPQVQSSLHASLVALAEALSVLGDRSAALDNYREALAAAEASAASARSDIYALWRLADSYAGMSKLQEARAADLKTVPDQRRTCAQEACEWGRKALAVWDGWNQQAVSSIFNTTKREQAARALAQCEAALARLGATPGR